MAGCVPIAMKRAALYGRAPMIYDLELAFTLWGYLGARPTSSSTCELPRSRARRTTTGSSGQSSIRCPTPPSASRPPWSASGYRSGGNCSRHEEGLTTATAVTFKSAPGRWILLATVLGSSMASLDATVVNVALPVIGDDLNAGVEGLQWIVTAYALTLASLLLLGGSLGDHYGRRRVFVTGVVWFAVASVLCAVANSLNLLIGARALQGIGGALLTPGSLAIIQSSFRPDDRGPAIGAWSGMSGLASAAGPFLGGWLISNANWRWIFLLNVPLSALVAWVSARHVPESRDPTVVSRLDPVGAVLTIGGLGALTFGLIERDLVIGVVGLAMLAAFVVVERRSDHPMLDLSVFKSPQFTGANIVTFVLYAALSGAFFVIVLALQQGMGYSPTAAGASLIPVTVLMLVLSPRAGALAQRIGPRLPMTIGPIVAGGGLLLLGRLDPGDAFLTAVLPAMVVFGQGLALTVAPLTAAVLSAVASEHAGIASAVNNAVARVAGLLAVAVLPVVLGLEGADFDRPAVMMTALSDGMMLTGVLCIVAGAISWLTIRSDQPVNARFAEERHCALESPPLRPESHCTGEAAEAA